MKRTKEKNKNKNKYEQQPEISEKLKTLKLKNEKKYNFYMKIFSIKNFFAPFFKLPILLIVFSIIVYGFFKLYSSLNMYINLVPELIYYIASGVILLTSTLIVLRDTIKLVKVKLFAEKQRGTTTELK